jgi:hypothetical protein
MKLSVDYSPKKPAGGETLISLLVTAAKKNVAAFGAVFAGCACEGLCALAKFATYLN